MQVFRRIKTQLPQTMCTFPTGTNAPASTHKRDFFSALKVLRPYWLLTYMWLSVPDQPCHRQAGKLGGKQWRG